MGHRVAAEARSDRRAAYVADVKVAPTKTADGHVRLICAKDRHGTHQRDHMVADVHIRNLDGGVRLHLAAPATTFRPTVLMERVSRFLEETPTSSLRGVHRGVTGKNETLTLALNSLLAEGYVRCDTVAVAQQWSSVELFRAPDDELAHPPTLWITPKKATAPHQAPPAGPRRRGRGVRSTRPLAVPGPLRRGRTGTRSSPLEPQETPQAPP